MQRILNTFLYKGIRVQSISLKVTKGFQQFILVELRSPGYQPLLFRALLEETMDEQEESRRADGYEAESHPPSPTARPEQGAQGGQAAFYRAR